MWTNLLCLVVVLISVHVVWLLRLLAWVNVGRCVDSFQAASGTVVERR